jgi:hypothetical protein
MWKETEVRVKFARRWPLKLDELKRKVREKEASEARLMAVSIDRSREDS